MLNASASGGATSGFYAGQYEDNPKDIACLLNLATAMQQIHLRQGVVVDYFKTIYINDQPLQADSVSRSKRPAYFSRTTKTCWRTRFSR